jgi:hypothetical protein
MLLAAALLTLTLLGAGRKDLWASGRFDRSQAGRAGADDP